uniref:ABC transporter substrate-binding protein n=1 Tax=Nocardioides sp. TaxID=35761 RepID=UPI002B26C2EE
MGASRTSSRSSRLVVGAVAAGLCLALAACGSNIEPGQAGLAAGLTQAGSGGTVVSGTDSGVPVDSGPGTVDPGSAPDPGAPDAGSSVDPGTSGSGPDAAAPAPVDGGGGGGGGGGETQPDPGTPKAPTKGVSCDGFSNGTGITDSTITIGNASDISGPVPGLFAQSQAAMAAFVKYYNDSGQTICGRTLKLAPYDSRSDAGADQQAYAKGCDEVFAMVGSMSAFDSGGASVAQKCGLPDIRSISTTAARGACTTCYAAQPAGSSEFQNVVADYVKRNASGGQKAAMLYIDAGAAEESGRSQVKFMTEQGVKFVYVAGVDVASFNYAPYVQAMKDAGVTSVQFIAAEPQFVRLVQTMKQQNFKPELLLLDPTAYSEQYTEPAGDAAIGTTVFTNFVPFEEAASNAELRLYLSYLEQTSPGARPGFFGLFSWSAGQLFVQQATALGGGLTRESLIASMKGVDDWSANGMHAPMPVGPKRITPCWRF